MSSLYVTVLIGLFLMCLVVWFLYFRHFHIGYGMVLVRQESDGTVWVASRLLNSPAGKAEVQNQSKVLMVDDQPVRFLTENSFKEWVKKSKPVPRKEQVWLFSDGLHLKLKPELITCPIPVWWSPNSEYAFSYEHNPDFNTGLFWCTKTGQFVFRRSISFSALESAYR